MRHLAVIPARGGSKSVPGKNLRSIGGRPLIGWTIEHALTARNIDRVVVSTDSPDIAAAARECGAEVPFLRPARFATDMATSESALIHAVEMLEREGYVPDTVVLLQATSPVRRPGMIDRALAQFATSNADSLLSVVANSHFFWRRGSVAEALYDYANRPRRQDIPEDARWWRETGSLYATSLPILKELGNRLGGHISLFETSEEEACEIDSETDLVVAAALLEHGKPRVLPARDEIRVAAFDCDGVLTDNRVHVNERGEESIAFNRSDGLALERLRASGLDCVIVSTEKNPAVGFRARKLGIPVLQGLADKGTALEEYCAERSIGLADVLYVGNDLNDLPPMRKVGWPVAVADAHRDVRAAARIVLTRPGGAAIVQEIADALLARNA